MLLMIVEEADQAKSATERRKLLDELLLKSGELVREFPDALPVWTLRAAAALELEQERMGWEAGSELIRLGAEKSDDSKVRQLLAKLDRKGWLKTTQQMAAEIASRERWAKGNSLGMKFVPVPGTDVLFCVWETRKSDYAAYARAKVGTDNSWQNVTFEGDVVSKGDDHPVVEVSWAEAKAFCQWLTDKERAEGLLPTTASYRLPTDLEWSTAVGLEGESGATPWDRKGRVPGVYPWGRQWPPPTGAGNFSDATFKEAYPRLPSYISVIEGYRDGFATTAPVGSFGANRYGLHDLGGNVAEWCEDWSTSEQEARAIRGGSFYGAEPPHLLSSARAHWRPNMRMVTLGFRLVLAPVSVR